MGGKAETGQTKRLLTALYPTGLNGGVVELRERGDEAIISRTFAKSELGAQEYCDKKGTRAANGGAVYFGVASRDPNVPTDKRGKKEGVLDVPALWADIDVKKLGWDFPTVVRAFHDLPGAMRPGALVFSGGGLHAYWFLHEPLETDGAYGERTKLFEAVNKQVQLHCASDMVWDITRVLRAPGTFNRRANKLSRIVWCYPWSRAPLDAYAELWGADNKDAPWLGPDGFGDERWLPKSELRGISEHRAWQHVSKDKRRGRIERIDDVWAMTRVGGGGVYHGIDEAQMLTTAYEWISAQPLVTDAAREAKFETIVRRTLDRTREVAEAEGVALSWDWTAEEDKVRTKLTRWIEKWTWLSQQHEIEKKAAAKEKRKNDKASKADGRNVRPAAQPGA